MAKPAEAIGRSLVTAQRALRRRYRLEGVGYEAVGRMKGKLSTTVVLTVTLTRRGQCVLGRSPVSFDVGGSRFVVACASER